jgi:hypothetical protein
VSDDGHGLLFWGGGPALTEHVPGDDPGDSTLCLERQGTGLEALLQLPCYECQEHLVMTHREMAAWPEIQEPSGGTSRRIFCRRCQPEGPHGRT